MSDIGPRDELYMINPDGKLEKMDPNEHHLEHLMNFYPDEEDYNEDFWDTIFDGGWIRIELKENHRNGWDLAVNGKSLYRMKAVIRDNFFERLRRGENKVHIEEWTGAGFNPTHIFYLPAQKDELFDFIFEKAKAKFIYEALDFERGLDPKESMKIGLYKWRNITWENILKCKEDFVLYNSDLNSPEKQWPKKFLKGQNLIVKSVEWFVSTIVDYKREKKTPKLQIAYWVVDANGTNIDSGVMKGTTDKFMKYFDLTDNKSLEESINFERGINPKEAMTIGTEAQKKKLDKETDWGFEISQAFQVRVWDIIKYEGSLIKISQLMGSDGIAYYMALNDTGEPYNNTPPMYDTPEEALDWEQKYIDQYNMGL